MKKTIYGVLFLLGAILSIVLVCNELNTFAIVSVTLTIILLLCFLKTFFEVENPEATYDRTLRDLLKTYEPLLVDVRKLPDLDVKNIIVTSSFEKMVDIQYELKKPIFYKKCLNTCSFVLLDNDVAYVHIMRIRPESLSPLDDVIKNIEIENKKRRKDKKILEGIDKTTIIKLDDFTEYKVSPVRKKDLSITEEIKIDSDKLDKIKNEEETTKETKEVEKEQKVKESNETEVIEKKIETSVEDLTEESVNVEEQNSEIEDKNDIEELVVDEVVEEEIPAEEVAELNEEVVDTTEEIIETKEEVDKESIETEVEKKKDVEEKNETPKKKSRVTARSKKWRVAQNKAKQNK